MSSPAQIFIKNYVNENGWSEIIYIDNLMGTIRDAKGNNKISNSNRNWIELKKGRNVITVTGSCSIHIESYFPMMV